MIDLPPEFEADIQGQDLNLYPIVDVQRSRGIVPPSGMEIEDTGIVLVNSIVSDTESILFTSNYASQASFFSRGDYLKIDDEYLYVTEVVWEVDDYYGYVMIERGIFQTPIPEEHSIGAVIERITTIVDIFISTKDVTLDISHYRPLLLNIPSIKESMDFENRNYKISNVTLKISNYEYDGERFSDYAGNLINTRVVISWVSQSENILEVYNGFVRRYSQDSETITLQLEDISQKDLHADLPKARLGDGPEVPDRFKNHPLPMVYGEVVNSPVVITRDVEQQLGDVHCFVDNVEGVPGVDAVEIEEVVGETFNIDGRQSWLNLAKDGVDSYLLDVAFEGKMSDSIAPAPESMGSEQRLQFTKAESGKVTGHIFSILVTELESIYNPLFHGLCNAIQIDKIEHDDNYGVGIKQSAINVNLPEQDAPYVPQGTSGTITWATSPYSYGGANFTSVSVSGLWRTFQPMQAEMWNEFPLVCNGYQGNNPTFYYIIGGRICISVSEPLEQADQSTHYQSVMWHFWDSRAIVSGVSNPGGYYGYMYFADLGLGYPDPNNNYFLWIPPDTEDGTVIEGGVPLAHSKFSFKREKASELTIFVDAPLHGTHTLDSFEFKTQCVRSYWVEDPFSQDLFAHVKGRKDNLYQG